MRHHPTSGRARARSASEAASTSERPTSHGGAEGRTERIIVDRSLIGEVGFEFKADARHFQDAMRERLAAFALSLHPDKTHLIAFGRFAARDRQRRGLGKPDTFTFLGFTFICGNSRQGRFQVRRKSHGDRMRVTLEAVKDGLRRRMHQPVPVQGRWLKQVVTGYNNYHAVPTNSGPWRPSAPTSSTCGGARFGGAARRTPRRRNRIARIADD